jgi:hypothetical protein
MDINILKKQNRLIFNDDGKVYVKPITQTTYETYPLKSLTRCIVITPEEYVLLKANYYRFNKTLTELEIND